MEHIETLENLEKFLELELTPYESKPRIDHPGIRISHACENITRLIKSGDRAAAELGCQIILRDPHLPFGKLIKSGIARALRQRIELMSDSDRDGLIEKTSELLSLQFCPRETEDYCKVVRKLGPAAIRLVVNNSQAKNEKSKKLLAYLSEP
jgi:hypothetical protein